MAAEGPSLTEWHLTWKCRQSKGVSLNSSIWKNLHPQTPISACWMFMKIKEWMWTQWGSGWWCFSSGNSDVRDKLHSGKPYRLLQAWHAGSRSSQAKNVELAVVIVLEKIVFCSWEFVLSVLLCSLYFGVSMGINRRHYFQRNLHILRLHVAILCDIWKKNTTSLKVQVPLVILYCNFTLTVSLCSYSTQSSYMTIWSQIQVLVI